MQDNVLLYILFTPESSTFDVQAWRARLVQLREEAGMAGQTGELYALARDCFGLAVERDLAPGCTGRR